MVLPGLQRYSPQPKNQTKRLHLAHITHHSEYSIEEIQIADESVWEYNDNLREQG